MRDNEELQGERCRRYVREIVESTRFTEDVVSGILAFGRQDPTADREHDALAILGEAVCFCAGHLPSSVSIRQTGFDPSGPLARLRIRVNRTALCQVLTNVFLNAAEASGGKGEIAVALSAAAPESPSELTISITDTGRGIDPITMKRIFETFFTTKSPGRGTGLGLSMCSGIVERWGGCIEAQSVPGKGTSFHIFIPVVGDPGEG